MSSQFRNTNWKKENWSKSDRLITLNDRTEDSVSIRRGNIYSVYSVSLPIKLEFLEINGSDWDAADFSLVSESYKDPAFLVFSQDVFSTTTTFFSISIPRGTITKINDIQTDMGIKKYNISYSGYEINVPLIDGIHLLPNWIEETTEASKPTVNLDDKCPKCYSMGVIRGTCCICPDCGHIIWGC